MWSNVDLSPHTHIVLIDDVITSGAHFAACKRKIRTNYPNMDIVGVFWAKSIRQ